MSEADNTQRTPAAGTAGTSAPGRAPLVSGPILPRDGPGVKAFYHLARLRAGAADADLDAIRAAWPDGPVNGGRPDLALIEAWLAERPDLALELTRIDPEAPEPTEETEPAAVIGSANVPDLPRAARLKVDASGAGRLLDEWLQYATAASPSTPALFHEAAGLWLGGLAIARRLRAVLPHGDIWPHLYALQVAPTTLYAKSTGLRLAADLLDQVLPHMRLACEFTPEALLADLAGREPTGLQDADAETRELWTAGRNLAGQRGIVLDEASALFAGFKRDYMQGTAELFLWLYDAPERRERVTRGGGLLVVRNAALSFLGATTPSSLARSEVGSAWHTGLFARFAMLTPDRPPVYSRGTERPRIPDALLTGLHRLAAELLPVPVWPDPPTVRDAALSDDARDAWGRYDKAVRFDLLAGDDPPDGRLWGTYARLPTQAMKVALILAALDWAVGLQQEPVITLAHWTRGQAIAETWRASAHRLLAILSGDGATAEAEDRLEHLIRRAGARGITARALQRATGQKRDDLERMLDTLRRDGLIVQKARQTRGPATMVYFWAGDGHE